ncbi:dihydrodipicolinate synthase family protein [Rhabdobacter roseus]|uniref:4-hydroxy-tetrahydrodipicolinate synthase n=1 Tax=Rhabdobacter roseus TaxID=1655419 RepID=A0A840TK25_9BACT|nr:dihydrodipicolinate synthase family protein [Rhabdobacter roseus]MBB5283791.1 4-hydroxy-tetrahydrodipicolinate synthase [Rhabdobacter roseus]
MSTPKKGLIPVMVLPRKTNGTIDYYTLDAFVDFFLDAGVMGLFANCLSTEMYFLNNEERLAHTARVVERVNGQIPVVATGTFEGTVAQQADFCKRIYDTGVEAVVVITSQMAQAHESDEVFLARMEELLARTGNIPLGFYECPLPYKRLLSPAILAQLLPTGRLHYHKDTSCSVEDVKQKLDVIKGTSFRFFDAHLPNALASLRMGADGLSAIAGNSFPEVLTWLCENYDLPERQEDVEWLQQELTDTNALIHLAYPVGAKYFLQRRGLPFQRLSRTHTPDLTDAERIQFDGLFARWESWCERLGITVQI